MKRILLVDDDVDLLAAMKIFLQREGYEVAVTTSLMWETTMGG